VGLAARLTFLVQNELWDNEVLPVDDWETFVLDVAASRLDRDQTTRRLKKLVGLRKKKLCKGKT
jgi:hypothetical protein